ncbi:MAG: hypothetical protein E7068_09055 [Lentimicrobiaceae bacterium]|nr:hypothetical protein [Lentimicrobiaceae bacterium]
MGMPSTKAECDKEIAKKKREIEYTKVSLSKAPKNTPYSMGLKDKIASLKGDIADLQAHKRTLK